MKLTQSSPFGKLLRHTARPGASALGRFMLWGDLAKAFREVARALKPSGTFAVFIEAADPEGARIWTDVVPGMRVRTAEELSELLVAAGFSQPAVHHKSASANAWTCLVAEKGKA